MASHIAKNSGVLRSISLALLLFFLADSTHAQRDQGFTVTGVMGPSFVERGHNFSLTCLYDMGECRLFNVLWKLNETQFFLYHVDDGGSSSNDAPVHVDVNASNATTVVITTARLRDAGVYKCEVTTQGDEYFLSSAEISLAVGVMPRRNPVIKLSGEPMQEAEKAELEKKVGEKVKFECVSAPSFPASQLSWLINGRVVQKGLAPPVVKREPDGTFTTKLELNLTLVAKHFEGGQVVLQCRNELQQTSLLSTPLRLRDPSYEGDSASSSGFVAKARWSMTALQLTLQVTILIVVELLF